MDTLVAGLTAGQQFPFVKATVTAVAGSLYSLWRATGQPAQGAIPGAAATPTDALLGAFTEGYTNPTSPALGYLAQVEVVASNAETIAIYDRLSHMGGLNGTLTTAQTVSCTLPSTRGGTLANGYSEGTEWFMECYTATGATSVTATISYTNEAGTAGRTTTVTVPATWPASRLLPILPASGDKWIRSVETVTLSASTLTAGSFGVTAGRRLCNVMIPLANLGQSRDAVQLGLPRVYDDACLWGVVQCTTTSTGQINGSFTIARQ